MKIRFFGDSYDIVKKSLIAWLGDFGDWSAHPMFTEEVPPSKVREFARFLNVSILSDEQLTSKTDRTVYFSKCTAAKNLFLDPDTGIRLPRCGGIKSTKYVFGSELVEWSRARPSGLRLVFDQSYGRGTQDSEIQEKLRYFYHEGINGFAYCSHAPFLILGADPMLIKQARKRVVEVSGLPSSRIVSLNNE